MRLDEVARAAFFQSTNQVPAPGSAVVVTGLVGGRLVVVDTTSGYELGYLPTRLSWLASYLDEWTYSGEVTDSALKPIPAVTVDLEPA